MRTCLGDILVERSWTHLFPLFNFIDKHDAMITEAKYELEMPNVTLSGYIFSNSGDVAA